MDTLDRIRSWLAERFAGLVAAHDVPGAAVAVLAGEETAEAATGVLNTATGVATTTTSVFQLASVTKLWTATLVMQLVDEGALDLDRPVRTYLPGFRVADERASAAVTPRQLLSHTAGFDAEPFTETTHGDDAIARFVDDHLPTCGQLFEPGAGFSYNNSGFSLLGRIVEVLRGKPYRHVLREHLVDPLGLEHVATRAEEAVRFRASVGHRPAGPEADQTPGSRWALPFSNEPAGAMLAMSGPDLLQFARMHLRGGLAPDGTRLVSESRIRAMREPQVLLPPLRPYPVHWGLGLQIEHPDHPRGPGAGGDPPAGRTGRPAGPVIGHDGDNIGQFARLRLVPNRGVAFVLFGNGGRIGGLFHALTAHLLAELADVDLPPRLAPPAEPRPVDPHRYVGRYRAAEGTCTVDAGGSGAPASELWLTLEPSAATAGIVGGAPTSRHRIVCHHGDTFVTADGGDDGHRSFAFVGDDGHGRATFAHHLRAIPRIP